MKKQITKAAIALFSLGLVSVGAWMIYRPAGLITPGLLIWLTISFGSTK